MIHFSQTAEEEIHALATDLQLIPIAKLLNETTEIPSELAEAINSLILSILDMFDLSSPVVQNTEHPEDTLRRISREINISRFLRERALVRLHKLTRGTVTDERTGKQVPLFSKVINPNTNTTFQRQEDFIGWFCEEAKVARSLVFQRLATFDRILSLGFSDQEAFEVILSKPYAIRETLNNVVDVWKEGDIKSINPEKAVNLTRRLAPEKLDQIQTLAESVKQNPGKMYELADEMRPVLKGLITEVAEHERSKEVLDYVKHDLLLQPEIHYYIRVDHPTNGIYLEIELIKKTQVNGMDTIADVIRIPFIPDITADVPNEIIMDLIKRLPIRNRNDLDGLFVS